MLLKILRALNPLSWFLAYKTIQMRKQKLAVSEFAHKHRHLVVMVLDPATDEMFMAYRDRQILQKIKSADGNNYHVVKNVMSAGRFKGNIDRLIVALVEFMKVPLTNPHMQQFIKWVDGAAYRISRTIKSDKVNEEFSQFINKEKEKTINNQGV